VKTGKLSNITNRWKQWAENMEIEAAAIYLAYHDPRVSLPARIVAVCVVAYALSPIDLIPDFIPVLGYLDDLILIPLGVKLALSLIPAAIMDEHRVTARASRADHKPFRAGAILVVIIWIAVAVWLFRLIR